MGMNGLEYLAARAMGPVRPAVQGGSLPWKS